MNWSTSSCTRPIGSYRQEIESRAKELSNNKLMLCLSSGMDSQIVLHTFKSLGIPFDCAFLRTDGFKLYQCMDCGCVGVKNVVEALHIPDSASD